MSAADFQCSRSHAPYFRKADTDIPGTGGVSHKWSRQILKIYLEHETFEFERLWPQRNEGLILTSS